MNIWDYSEFKTLQLTFTSDCDFNGNAVYVEDWLREKHFDYSICKNKIELFIMVSEITLKELVDNLISCCKLVFSYDNESDFMFDLIDFKKSHYFLKTASTKYPFNACVFGYGNDLSGGVTENIVKDMEKSFSEMEKVMTDEKDKASLKDAFRISKQTLSAKYLNELARFSGNDEVGKLADKWYKAILDRCTSNETREEALGIVKKEFTGSGYKFVKRSNIFGGLPVQIFEKNGRYFYIPIHEVYYLFRRGGQHKVEIYANDDVNDNNYSIYNVRGGLANMIKFCNGIKQSSKMDRIARKVYLAFTKKDLLSFLKYKLGSDDKWALRALQRIYEGQTQEELNEESTKELNGLGFTGFDAPILTSIYKSYLEHNKRLTPKQMNVVKKMMQKYAGQIFRSPYMNKTQLEKVYEEYLKSNLF